MHAEITQRPVITLQPVESSQITAIGHDKATNTLAIQFKSYTDRPGSVYHYDNFTEAQFAEFKSAPSIGSHFGKVIKPFPEQFPYTKIS